jgi:enoyl-CoA hydratase/carnithine racemase
MPVPEHRGSPHRWVASVVLCGSIQALSSFPGIIVALAKGDVRGFGFGLAVHCDVTLAAENAHFSFPEIKAGFPPSVVMSYLSGGRRARRRTSS